MKSSYISFVVVLLGSVGQSLSQPAERIVNGQQIDIQKAPWQIALLDNFKILCGGSILSNQIILTAAHCLKGRDPKNLTVRAGSSFWSHGGQFRLVEHFIYHSEYDGIQLRNDFGVIRLTQPLKYGPGVHPIQLAQKPPKHGEIGYASGWGSLSYDHLVYPATLHGVDTSIYDQATCATICAQQGIMIDELNVCTDGVEQGVCHGDSGGPLVVNGHLAGVVSGGAPSKTPGVFGNVALFYDWIQGAIKHLEASCADIAL